MKEFSKIYYHYFFFIILFIIQIIIFKDYGFPNDEEISRLNGLGRSGLISSRLGWHRTDFFGLNQSERL